MMKPCENTTAVMAASPASVTNGLRLMPRNFNFLLQLVQNAKRVRFLIEKPVRYRKRLPDVKAAACTKCQKKSFLNRIAGWISEKVARTNKIIFNHYYFRKLNKTCATLQQEKKQGAEKLSFGTFAVTFTTISKKGCSTRFFCSQRNGRLPQHPKG